MANNSDAAANTADFVSLPAAPVLPPPGTIRLYADSTGKFQALDSLGNDALAKSILTLSGSPGNFIALNPFSITIQAAQTNATVSISAVSTLTLNVNGALIQLQTSKIGFFGATPAVKPTISGSRAANAALASLLTQLATLGLIVDSTTA